MTNRGANSTRPNRSRNVQSASGVKKNTPGLGHQNVATQLNKVSPRIMGVSGGRLWLLWIFMIPHQAHIRLGGQAALPTHTIEIIGEKTPGPEHPNL